MSNEMCFDSGYFSIADKSRYESKTNKFDLDTKFNFLRQHNGLRKRKLHTFIAPTGVGKSTFVRTLVRDIIFGNKESKILLWLSEETTDEFKCELSVGVPVTFELDRVSVFSEQSNPKMDIQDIIKSINDFCEYSRPDVLIIDNITTSKIYRDKKVDHQSEIASWLKSLTRFGCAVFVVAHTNAEVTENFQKLIDENHIRGAKSIALISEFFYILQPFYVNNSLFQFIRIKKNRGQDVEEKLFQLNYDKRLRAFSNDMPVDFKKFIEIFRLRNKLG